jgi:hypothetical protein
VRTLGEEPARLDPDSRKSSREILSIESLIAPMTSWIGTHSKAFEDDASPSDIFEQSRVYEDNSVCLNALQLANSLPSETIQMIAMKSLCASIPFHFPLVLTL